jgi:hypothetical protein
MYNSSLGFDSVIVVESVGEGDLRTGRDLFETVLAPAAVADPSFLTELRAPRTRTEFMNDLREIADNAKRYGSSPIVHIETHGGQAGISLGNSESVSWDDIAAVLAVINETSRMNLLVVAAMCHGQHMSDILRPTDRAPAFAIIGARGEIKGRVLLASMQAFYGTILSKPHDIIAGLKAANAPFSLGDGPFGLFGAELFFCNVWKRYVTSLRDEETQEARVNRLVTEIARVRGLDVLQTAELRLSISSDINDHPTWFSYYKTRFLMLDLFPENESRFPLTVHDCMPDAA